MEHPEMNRLTILNYIVLVPVLIGMAYIGVRIVLKLALRRNYLDVPNYRSSHSIPTPKGGGVVIVVMSVVAFGVALFFESPLSKLPYFAFLNATVLISVVSWLDDMKPMPVLLRLAAHSTAAAMIIASLLIVSISSEAWILSPMVLAMSIGSFIWLVGLTNAYNFMDGIDGMAGLQAFVGGAAWSFLGWYCQLPVVMIFGIVLACSSAGFLGHNWAPARIFMGDVCSTFLGFTFAALPLITAQYDLKLLIVGPLILWPFIFDAGITVIRRALKGENVFLAHRSHLYQRLIIAGFPHAQITSLYGILSASITLMAIAWYVDMIIVGIGFNLLLFASALILWVNTQEPRKSSAKQLESTIGVELPASSALPKAS